MAQQEQKPRPRVSAAAASRAKQAKDTHTRYTADRKQVVCSDRFGKDKVATNPSSYSYHHERCSLATSPSTQRKTITRATNRKEFDNLTRILDDHISCGPELDVVPKHELRISPAAVNAVFSDMMLSENRLKFPDPEVRLKHVVKSYKQMPQPPRCRVFMLMRIALGTFM